MVRAIARDSRDTLGEGLMWSAAQNALFWTDILECKLYRMDLATEKVESWTMPDTIGWILECTDGGLVAGIGRTISRLSLDPLHIEPLTRLETERENNRLNDAKVDPEGNIWAGTMSMEGDSPLGALYRIRPDGVATRIEDGYYITNGPAMSPDGRWFYHTDTGRSSIYRFALDKGTIRGKGTFIEFPTDWGNPDGMTCDSEGGLWITHWGGSCVSRFTPDGVRDQVIELPTSQITNCIFAGPNLDRMFVTSASYRIDDPKAGQLFEVETGYRGFAAPRFGG